MATLFTRIIDGQIPAHHVWQDERCVAFLVIDPLTDGHTIVVPREEVAHWVDADDDLLAHLQRVARQVGLAQMRAFSPVRIGQMVMGYEVPHLHVHVFPSTSEADFSLANVTRGQDQQVLAENARRLRAALRELGHDAEVTGE